MSRWSWLDCVAGGTLSVHKWNEIQARQGNAETASLLDAVQGHDDVSQLREINKSNINADQFQVSQHILNAVGNYYENSEFGRRVKSFISFPLPCPEGNEAKAFGVLNIHCEEKSFLGPAGPQDSLNRQRSFAGIVTPIVFATAELVYQWWQAAGSTYPPE